MTGQRRTKRRQGQAVKIVVTGPFAAGKTTLIRTISEITVLSTERNVTDETKAIKSNTTVAMDFGRISLDRDLVLYLFGTPGQARFDFMWEILSEGMLGYILLVDGQQPATLEKAAEIRSAFSALAKVPYLVAVNRRDSLTEAEELEMRAMLGIGRKVPIIACDAADRDSVKAVLLALLYHILDAIESAAANG